jgi:peptidyl-prolyl cis-trans isomerase B (cyclophilin B)
VASTKDRQRALERARYERVQAKMQAKRREARRKTRLALVSSIAAVVVIGGVVAGVVATTGSSSNTKAAAAGSTATSSSAAASATPAATSSAAGNPLAYEASGTPAVKGIGIPTFNAAEAEQTYTATIQTNLGNIVFTANGKAAPYTVYSFLYLTEKNYFNNTKCHRLTTSGIYVLQCGDPTGTGSGGPGYTIPDENLASLGTGSTVTYKAGTVAMANTGQPHTGGSQFFLVYKDSPLGPSYTPFGTITQGMNILQQIAAKGAAPADANGNTAPNESVQIEKFTMTKS